MQRQSKRMIANRAVVKRQGKPHRDEKNKDHFCYVCGRRGRDRWELAGYDENGELWICSRCRDEGRGGPPAVDDDDWKTSDYS